MIEVSVRKDGVAVNGHSGYAESGKDIVCAGVSVLFQTMIQSIQRLTNDEITYKIVPGASNMAYRNLSEKAKSLVDFFFIGVSMIAEDYPEYVQIV